MGLKPTLTFEEALNADGSDKSLLIGNGFSRSISNKFDYKTLFDLTKDPIIMGDECLYQTVDHIFSDLETTDFEKVLAHLDVSHKILCSYKKTLTLNNYINNLLDKMQNDINQIKKIFIKIINYVHGDLYSQITPNTSIKLGNFLKNFNSIFTINYDLCLYWILMKIKESDSKFKYDDGFRGNDWINNESQNIFYLHGALHIFNRQKLIRTKDKQLSFLIEEKIMNSIYPLTVMEGKYTKKVKFITNNSYLDDCFKKLKSRDGSLFILGTSLNEHSDNHIYTQIKDSAFHTIYYGVFEFDKKSKIEIERIKSMNKTKVRLFDAHSAITWHTIEENRPNEIGFME
ncbi:MAG: DUF4917 family protein [Legionella sp.]|nr:DUF4917 family protein [Legionella sp.]